jgi:hypothetical protein
MVSGTWNSEEERRLLVHTMADTLRMSTLALISLACNLLTQV